MQIKIRNVKSERFEKTFTQPLTIAAIGISFDKKRFLCQLYFILQKGTRKEKCFTT